MTAFINTSMGGGCIKSARYIYVQDQHMLICFLIYYKTIQTFYKLVYEFL